MAYHYTECGLDNVYLENGFTVHKTAYGRGVSIDDTEALHKTIGEWIIALPKPLNGAELRFLRTELDMTQKDLGNILGTTEQTLRLWEKRRAKPIPSGPADRLLRAFYGEWLHGRGSVIQMTERLARQRHIKGAKGRLSKSPRGGWRLAEKIAA
jgi:DNA-binding transcriptional regulator YiaG